MIDASKSPPNKLTPLNKKLKFKDCSAISIVIINIIPEVRLYSIDLSRLKLTAVEVKINNIEVNNIFFLSVNSKNISFTLSIRQCIKGS